MIDLKSQQNKTTQNIEMGVLLNEIETRLRIINQSAPLERNKPSVDLWIQRFFCAIASEYFALWLEDFTRIEADYARQLIDIHETQLLGIPVTFLSLSPN